MRAATLQFTPTLGDVASSIAHAESLLYEDESRLRDLNLLVLPELAFTGMSSQSVPSALNFLHRFLSRLLHLVVSTCVYGQISVLYGLRRALIRGASMSLLSLIHPLRLEISRLMSQTPTSAMNHPDKQLYPSG